jgi:hypothetical protein
MGNSFFSKFQRQIQTFTKFKNILDFVHWTDNPSAIEIPDYPQLDTVLILRSAEPFRNIFGVEFFR